MAKHPGNAALQAEGAQALASLELTDEPVIAPPERVRDSIGASGGRPATAGGRRATAEGGGGGGLGASRGGRGDGADGTAR